ncbi:tRNA (adenosine(37)-N6)-dimethylallyltransferase MiaA [Radiobacillus sp. PE A8.2]|uniref:tRNA (adenosine(37)-N6)-dimethylallyltransferase MiaA n=1 Tax=Radiobacillus sp. PE A8.2 TaxID=3380349 RepID=UPI00388FBCF4
MKNTVVAVVGPTAVGKTSLSIEIAKRFNGEVISGDSMQIYKQMDIGTAKVTKQEMGDVPHRMIDIKQADESFSVAEFQTSVRTSISDIIGENRLPIIAGGTGLYIQAALFEYNFAEEARDASYQKIIEQRINEYGIDFVYKQLQKADPEQAQRIHPNNIRRVIRALEVYERTGKTMSEHHEQQQPNSPYKPILIGLEMERELLYKRINNRVDVMMEEGLLEEVHSFYERGLEHSQSMKAIGYKEFIPYFKGEQSLQESVELLKRNSRRFAKRQFTWFKNKMDVTWYKISPEQKDEKFAIILENLAGKLTEK